MRKTETEELKPGEKSPAFLAYRERTDAELAHQRGGGSPRVYFEPTWNANGVMDPRTERFRPNQVPEGFRLDVKAWVRAGSSGPAPLIAVTEEAPASAPAVVAEEPTNG